MNNWIKYFGATIILYFSLFSSQAKSRHMDSVLNNSLGAKERSIISIASITAKGDLSALKKALNAGIEAGLTVNEIKEVLVHLYAYCGFPRSIRGLQTFMEVLQERKAKGINDQAGREATPIQENSPKYERGKKILGELTNMPQPDSLTGYSAFAPVIDSFLKEHLFADIFERDVLSYSQRELVTISVLAALGNVQPMLQGHLNISLNTGISAEQLTEFISIIKLTVGDQEASAAQTVLDGVLRNRKPFGLVYAGAITQNSKGEVNIHPVTYSIRGIKIVANIYTPANYDPTKQYPAIVVAHPNGGVKEQVSGLYAQRLAERGYITITADAAYQGGSGGSPRYVDKPANRIEDIHAMGDFISQYKGVDPARLGLLGICGGGGYSIKAAQSDKRFKAIATVSMFNSGLVRRNGFMNSQVSTIQERLKRASDARAIEASGGKVLYANNANAPLTAEQIEKLPFDLYREGYIYYNITHAHPNSSSNYTLSSLMDLMTFDANTNTDLINQPLLMITGSKADTKYMTDEVFVKAVNARNKEHYIIKGATHIETYWKAEYVSQAVNKLGEFFQKNL